MHQTNERLKELKLEHGLTAKDIAFLLNGNLGGPSQKTVESWLAKPGSPGYFKMPAGYVYLLEINL